MNREIGGQSSLQGVPTLCNSKEINEQRVGGQAPAVEDRLLLEFV